MSDISGAMDPFAQPGSARGTTQLEVARPAGSDLTLNDDGSADLMMPGPPGPPPQQDHYANLAETLPPNRLAEIARDLLDAIEVDIEARKQRDKQYEEGLRRTGLGDDAPGGASFPGASRVVHPVLTEACIDFSARVMAELMPPDGPVKAKTIGEPNNDKDDKADRVARYMNLQIMELMPNTPHEFEMGFTQCPLGGAFYSKMVYDADGPSAITITIDKVHRPWSDGAIYTQPRITHEMDVDRWQYAANVASGLWVDVLDPKVASDTPEETGSERSNDRIIGRNQPSENIDKVRRVFESSVIQGLEDSDDKTEPLLVTVDYDTRKILAIYRNWKPNDSAQKRLDFLIEWPFWPWRGGYPVGLTHMIGGLSGAATGSLRALLDSAFLSNSQTGVRLKGGATAGGQNIRAQPMQTTEVQGSLSQDDIRKTYMPLPFPAPSEVLFKLLGFTVDAARGVIRTTFDEYDKFSGNTPVGTANMFIEQGLKNLGAIHSRMHRSMRRFLKQLWEINAETLNDVQTQDSFGELIVTRADFAGPINVVPVSDPRIFSDMQRSAQAQMVVARAADPIAGSLYQHRNVELYFLKQMNVPQPEQFLVPQSQPVQQNAVAENTGASTGLPIKAFPGQDHEAHLAVHVAFMESQIFGSNTVIAPKYLPVMLPHIGEHVALWYADAMLDAANTALRERTGNPELTIESMAGPPYEAPLDRMLAELTPEVMMHANEALKEVPAIVARAQQLMQRFAPPMPMDPSIVAMKDVTRQETADQSKTQLTLVAEKSKAEQAQRKDALAQQKMEADAGKSEADIAFKTQEAERKHEIEMTKAMAAAHAESLKAQGVAMANDSAESVAQQRNQVDMTMNDEDNATAIEVAKIGANSRKAAASRSKAR